MKKLFFIFLLVISSNIYSDENAISLWMKSLNSSKEMQPEKALEEITQAISLMNSEDIEKFPDIISDRAFIYAQLQIPEKSIEEANKALSHKNLSKNGKLASYVAKTMSYNLLGDIEELEKNKEKMFEIVPVPHYEYTDNYIVITNIPKSKSFRDFITCISIHSRQAESKSKIHFYDDKCIIERMKNCGCSSNEPVDFICDNCGRNIVYGAATQESINDCMTRCNYVVAISQPTCDKVFRFNYACVMGCYAVLETLRNVCHKCCQSGEFWRYCVKPFENFVSQCPCDPFFD